MVPHRLGDPGQLGSGGDITHEHPSRGQRRGNHVKALPGGEHVKDHAVDGAVGAGLRQGLDEVADRDAPGRMVGPEVGPGVGLGDVGEVGAPLEGVEPPGLPDGPQQRHRQGPGPHPCLGNHGPGEDVGHGDDLSRILGIDDRGASGHRHDVVGQQGPQGEVFDPGGVLHRGPVRSTDEVIVGEVAAVGVELLTGGQGDGVQATPGVGELDALPHGERSAPKMDPGRLSHGAGV
jgi:hypothetical protein